MRITIRVLRLRERHLEFWGHATLDGEKGWLLAVGSSALFVGATRERGRR